MLKIPNGPPALQFGRIFELVRYCKRILNTLKSFCSFCALDMMLTYDVPGVLRRFEGFQSDNNFDGRPAAFKNAFIFMKTSKNSQTDEKIEIKSQNAKKSKNGNL